MARFPVLGDGLNLPDDAEQLGGTILGAAKEVLRELGPGVRERVYSRAMVIALRDLGVHEVREVPVGIRFRGEDVGVGFRMDLLVGESIVVELKSQPDLIPAMEAQLLTYMRGARKPLRFLVNFGAPAGHRWIVRKVLSEFA